MKRYNISNTLRHIAVVALCAAAFTACKEDETIIDPTFLIEGNPEAFEFSPEASGMTTDGYMDRDNSTRYTVRSNSRWHVELDEAAAQWIKVFPDEATGDGYFFVSVTENKRFDPRTADVRLVIDGVDAPVVIPVKQSGAAPKLQATRRMTVTAYGGESLIPVISNLAWSASKIEEAGSEWVNIKELKSNGIAIESQARDIDEPRTARIALDCPQVPSLNDTLTVIQYGPSIILYEEFDWLAAYPMKDNNWFNSTDPKRMDTWTDDMAANGWQCWTGSATVNGATSANVTVYGGSINDNGWAKLGRTGVNGNLVSPRFATIGKGNKRDVKITFDACPYVAAGTASKSSAYDSNRLYVFVYGGGELEGVNSTVKITDVVYNYNGNWETPFRASDYPSAEEAKLAKDAWFKAEAKPDMNGNHAAILYELTNYPMSKYTKIKMYADPLHCEAARHEIIVRNATENTQVVFQGGEWNDTWAGVANGTTTIVDLTGKSFSVPYAYQCNRIFIDNVVVRNLAE